MTDTSKEAGKALQNLSDWVRGAQNPTHPSDVNGSWISHLLIEYEKAHQKLTSERDALRAQLQAARDEAQSRLDELDAACANAERAGPSAPGYVTDATFHDWCGQRSAFNEVLRALKSTSAEGEG